jgi:hypothetical protein
LIGKGDGVDVGGKVTKLVFHSKGFRSILREAAVGQVTDRARRIAAAANTAAGTSDGFGYRVNVGANRVRATVNTETRAGAEAEATNKVLTRSIGAGRG